MSIAGAEAEASPAASGNAVVDRALAAALADTNEKWLISKGRLDYGPFSLADVCHAPFVCELAGVRLGRLLTERPAVARWVDRLNARPSIAATRPEPVG